MPHRKSIALTILISLVFTILSTIAFTQSVQAQTRADPTTESNDNCIKCHEDLYFLHDTGKWYCVSEAPMSCTGCHGGNGNVIDKEQAHTNRAAHPIVNGDVSKCQQCHPEQCDERVQIFKEEAGIPYIRVAAPYFPDQPIQEAAILTAQINTEQQSGSWVNLLEILPFILVTGAALMIYVVYGFRHRIK
jgi:hypothetical protein